MYASGNASLPETAHDLYETDRTRARHRRNKDARQDESPLGRTPGRPIPADQTETHRAPLQELRAFAGCAIASKRLIWASRFSRLPSGLAPMLALARQWLLTSRSHSPLSHTPVLAIGLASNLLLITCNAATFTSHSCPSSLRTRGWHECRSRSFEYGTLLLRATIPCTV
jgi:hypothetical protein